MDFKEKVVVITGASTGIGKATSIEFAKRGANIVLVARRDNKLNQVNQELSKFNVETLICPCDVSDKSQVQIMSKKVLEKFDKIDILVNNAGFAIYGSVSDLTIEEIESQMNTNYFGMVYCIKNFLPFFLKQNSGHIVNVASLAGSFGLPGIASYCATKFAMLGFSEGLKHELKGTGIGITVVSPIMVRTDFFEHPSFNKIPKYSPTSLSPQAVAKAIIKASNSSRLEITVPSIARAAIWAKHNLPYVIDSAISSSFSRQLKKKKNS